MSELDREPGMAGTAMGENPRNFAASAIGPVVHDGVGRSASDNNTPHLLSWFAY
jgi:hypothetical protein